MIDLKKCFIIFFIFIYSFGGIILSYSYNENNIRFLPGTYKGGYDFITPKLLGSFFVNIIEYSSLSDIINISKQTKYKELLEKAKQMLIQKNTEKDKNTLTLIGRNEKIFLKYIEGIHKMETGNNLSFNPRNHQGIFQLYSMESQSNRSICDESRTGKVRYSSCNDIQRVYEPLKELTEEDIIYQLLDFVYFWENKYTSDIYNRMITIQNEKLNKREVLRKLFQDLELSFDLNELEEFVRLFSNKEDYKKSNLMNSFYIKNKQILYNLGFDSVEDLFFFSEFYEIAFIGSLYNGLGNVGRYVFDNAYISSNPEIGLTFYKIGTDGGKKTTKSKQIGLLFQTYKLWGGDYKKGFIIYTVILKKLKDKNLF